MYAKYDTFDTDCAYVFYFGEDNRYDEVYVNNDKSGSKSRIFWRVGNGSNDRSLCEDSTCFELAWTHVVVTACGSTMRIYKNGKLSETKTDGQEPKKLTRDHHCIGCRGSKHSFFKGTVAYLRTWHGHELNGDEVQKLYAARNSPSLTLAPGETNGRTRGAKRRSAASSIARG